MEIEFPKNSRSVSKDLEKLSLENIEKNEEVKSEKKGGKEKDKSINVKEENDAKIDSKGKLIQLKKFFDEIEDFEQVLHILHQEGEKEGIKFKKGKIQYWDDGTDKYKAIICSCKNLHAKKKLLRERTKESLDNSKIKEPGISENENCPAFYRFKFKNNRMELISWEETHSNHELKIKKDSLKEEMIKDIECFTKNSSVSEIRDFLESASFRLKLSFFENASTILELIEQYKIFTNIFSS